MINCQSLIYVTNLQHKSRLFKNSKWNLLYSCQLFTSDLFEYFVTPYGLKFKWRDSVSHGSFIELEARDLYQMYIFLSTARLNLLENEMPFIVDIQVAELSQVAHLTPSQLIQLALVFEPTCTFCMMGSYASFSVCPSVCVCVSCVGHHFKGTII